MLSPVSSGMGGCLWASKLSHCVTATQANLAFHPLWVGTWVPATAGKAEADVAHSDCGWTCGCAGETVRSLENTCHTWALLRSYIKCMHPLPLPLPLPLLLQDVTYAVHLFHFLCSQTQLKSAQRDTNLHAGTLQPDRTF